MDLASARAARRLARLAERPPELAADVDRRLTATGITLDYSRQPVNAAVQAELLALAQECGVADARSRLFSGEALNVSEGRAAWHVALRADPPPASVAADIADVQARMRDLVERETADFTDVINIGIGGSDLGPRLVCQALGAASGLRPHFLGNLDSAHLRQVLAALEPRRCLVLVTSKTFTTLETMRCAEQVRSWLEAGGGRPERQCLAVTAAPERAEAFGIDPARIFAFWDWVGGRYSLWSAVGLSIALAHGWPAYRDLLAGAQAMDRHFRVAPPPENLPLNWALLGIWQRNFLGYPAQVTVPYSEHLAALPDWLQQLDMESNGKAIGREGQSLAHATVAMQWGGPGTPGQHAYFQFLHQSAMALPVDFVLPLQVPGMQPAIQRELLANALAQSAALALGRDAQDDDPRLQAWRHCPGGRPSSLVLLDRLDAFHLGALLAAYEHRCFVQGWIWGLNSFDQFGVELGKALAKDILNAADGDEAAWPDAIAARQAREIFAAIDGD